MFAESDLVTVAQIFAPIAATLAVGVVIWLKAAASEKMAAIAVRTAKTASDKADVSHKITEETRDLAVKTESQTNNRLSLLDAKVQAHELKCIESRAREADLQRQIAELKLALAHAQMNVPPLNNGG